MVGGGFWYTIGGGTDQRVWEVKLSDCKRDELPNESRRVVLVNHQKSAAVIDERISEPFFVIQWHITHRCNLRCIHCYLEEYRSEVSYNDLVVNFEKVIPLPIRLGQPVVVNITGGEPLVSPYFLPLLDYLHESRIVSYVQVLTNGVMVTERLAARLRRYPKVRMVQVSLDGGNAETHDAVRGRGTFCKALAGIDHLVKHHIPVQIQMVIHRGNRESLPDLVTVALKHGVRFLAVNPLIPIGQGKSMMHQLLTPQEYRQVLLYLEKVSQSYQGRLTVRKDKPLWGLINKAYRLACGAACPYAGLALSPEGDVFLCRRLPVSIGNVREKNIFELVYTAPMYWELQDPDNLKGKCGVCALRWYCRGCRGMAYGVYGDYLAPDPLCWLTDEVA